MNIHLAKIATISLAVALSGCQLTPTSSEHINLGGAESASGAMLETSYMCTDGDESKQQIISVFEDSRSPAHSTADTTKVASKKVTLRLGNKDYSMTALSDSRYISQQQSSAGQWLIWQPNPAALLTSKTANAANISHIALCQPTR